MSFEVGYYCPEELTDAEIESMKQAIFAQMDELAEKLAILEHEAGRRTFTRRTYPLP